MAEAEVKTKPKTDLENAKLLDDGRLYGPFNEWEFVNTSYGDYGVTLGLRLGFVARPWLDPATGQMSSQPYPVYFDLNGGEVMGNGQRPEDYPQHADHEKG